MNNSTIINQNMLDFSTERKLFILFAILFVFALIYQRRKILLLENESFISSEKEILNDFIIDKNSESPTTPKFGLKKFSLRLISYTISTWKSRKIRGIVSFY